MILSDLHIIPTDLLEDYKRSFNSAVKDAFEKLEDSELSKTTFSFYRSVSAVYSSRIEGEDIELDSFIRHKRFAGDYLPDHTKKIDDLYDAYQFAEKSPLTGTALII